MARNKIIKAGLGYTIGNYMLRGLSFISIPIYTRLLSTGNYGRFNNFLTYENIFFIIIGCAIQSSYKSARYRYKLQSEGVEKGKDYYTYTSTSVIFVLLCTLIWLILANIFLIYVTSWLNMDSFSVNLLIVYSAASTLVACFNEDISINYEYKKFLFVSSFNAIGTIVLSVILLLTIFARQRYFGMIIGASIPTIIAAGYIIVYFFKRAKPKNFKFFMKWGINYSLPIVPHGLSQIILNQFDRIMITKMVSVVAAGIYSFAYNIYSILAVTFNSLDNIWSPWFYEQMRAKNYKNIKKISSMYMCLMLIFTIELILISPEIIMLLGRKSYWSAKYTAIPVIAGGYFAFLYTIPAAVEYYHAKTNWIAIGTTMAAIINVLLNLVFIKSIGYIAAAYTTLFTYILYFVLHFFMAKKIQGWNLFSTRIILSCSGSLFLFSLIAMIFINVIWVRWLLACIIFCITAFLEEKNYGLVFKIINNIILKKGK